MNLPWRKPAPPEIRFVEVEKAVRVPEMNEDIAKMVGSLQSHPGFIYLLNKLRFHRAILQAQLAGNRQESMTDVVMLQSGCAWSGWLQREMEAAIGFKPEVSAPPSRSELAIFEEAQQQLEVLR